LEGTEKEALLALGSKAMPTMVWSCPVSTFIPRT